MKTLIRSFLQRTVLIEGVLQRQTERQLVQTLKLRTKGSVDDAFLMNFVSRIWQDEPPLYSEKLSEQSRAQQGSTNVPPPHIRLGDRTLLPAHLKEEFGRTLRMQKLYPFFSTNLRLYREGQYFGTLTIEPDFRPAPFDASNKLPEKRIKSISGKSAASSLAPATGRIASGTDTLLDTQSAANERNAGQSASTPSSRAAHNADKLTTSFASDHDLLDLQDISAETLGQASELDIYLDSLAQEAMP